MKRNAELWQVRVTVPMWLPQAERDRLFDAVADAAAAWEPEDRDNWDTIVTSAPVGERSI